MRPSRIIIIKQQAVSKQQELEVTHGQSCDLNHQGEIHTFVAFAIAYMTLIGVAWLDTTMTACITGKTISKTFCKSAPRHPDLLGSLQWFILTPSSQDSPVSPSQHQRVLQPVSLGIAALLRTGYVQVQVPADFRACRIMPLLLGNSGFSICFSFPRTPLYKY